MDIVRRVFPMRETCRQVRGTQRRIGFVPTMGALHDGHLELVRRVRELSDTVVVSVFVNPTQFGPNEDLERDPQDLARDADLLIRERVDYLFAPERDDMYPVGPATEVEVSELSTRLEGASRPGHFRGVATVVLKLFEIVRPHVAAFGQKDAQQVAVVRRMVRDLMLDVEILVVPTVRDADGVALSSRNAYLSSDERRSARALPRALDAVREAYASGMRDPEALRRTGRAVLEAEPLLRIDYFEIVDRDDFTPAVEASDRDLAVTAVYAGATRLLDNAPLGG